jgi:hypothetical protein
MSTTAVSRGSMEDLPRWEFEERPKFRRAHHARDLD